MADARTTAPTGGVPYKMPKEIWQAKWLLLNHAIATGGNDIFVNSSEDKISSVAATCSVYCNGRLPYWFRLHAVRLLFT